MRHLKLLLIFITLSQYALSEDFHYNYGIEGGINLSNVSTSNSSSNTLTHTSGTGGLYWEFFPKNWLSLVTGGFVVGKGYKETSTRSVILNYFQLRGLGRISLLRSPTYKFFIDLGPGADFAFQKGTKNFSEPPTMSNFRDFDLSLMGGIGFEADISKTTRIAFNLKYLQGVLNLVKNSTSSVKSNGILFTTAIQFSTESDRIEPTEERARKYLDEKSSGQKEEL